MSINYIAASVLEFLFASMRWYSALHLFNYIHSRHRKRTHSVCSVFRWYTVQHGVQRCDSNSTRVEQNLCGFPTRQKKINWILRLKSMKTASSNHRMYCVALMPFIWQQTIDDSSLHVCQTFLCPSSNKRNKTYSLFTMTRVSKFLIKLQSTFGLTQSYSTFKTPLFIHAPHLPHGWSMDWSRAIES